jgi:hypothetical protein
MIDLNETEKAALKAMQPSFIAKALIVLMAIFVAVGASMLEGALIGLLCSPFIAFLTWLISGTNVRSITINLSLVIACLFAFITLIRIVVKAYSSKGN